MRKLETFILIMIFVNQSAMSWESTKIDTVEVRFSNGQLKEKYQTVYWGGTESTGKSGFYNSWYLNGQLEWKGNFDSDRKIGCWIRWDSTSFLLSETNYDRGMKNGPDVEWNKDGTYKKYVNYKNDTLHGLCTWNKSGTIINGVLNNPDLVVDSQLFYLKGNILITMKRSDWPAGIHPAAGPPMPNYNQDLELWYETRNLYGFYNYINNDVSIFVGRKVQAKKEGMWIQYDKYGDIKKLEFFESGQLIYSEQL